MYIEFLLEKYVDQVYNGKMTKDEFFTKMEKAHQSEMHD